MVELLISTSSPSTGASWLKRAENMEVQVLREEYTLHYVLSKFWQARGEMVMKESTLQEFGGMEWHLKFSSVVAMDRIKGIILN